MAYKKTATPRTGTSRNVNKKADSSAYWASAKDRAHSPKLQPLKTATPKSADKNKLVPLREAKPKTADKSKLKSIRNTRDDLVPIKPRNPKTPVAKPKSKQKVY